MRGFIGRLDRVETLRWRGLVAGVVALTLALAVFGGLAATQPGASAADPTTFSFSDCASVNLNDLLTAFKNGESITYTGTSPCTVDLNENTLIAPTGVVVNMTIEGGAGLTLDESNTLQNEIDFSAVGPGSSLTLDNVTLKNNHIGIFAPGVTNPSITVTNSTVSSNGGGIDAAAAGSSTITVTNSAVSGINVERTVPGPTSSPTVIVTGSTISGGSDGINAENSAAPNITVTGSTVSGNAFNGINAYGAIGAHINVTNSTINNNTDDGINAGNPDTGWAGITVTGSTISGNSADGIDVKNAASPTISVTNSTLSGNTLCGIDAFQANGSSISVVNSTISGSADVAIDARYNNGSSISVIYSTISGNTYDGIVAFGQTSPPTVKLTATIMADNGPNNCSIDLGNAPVTDGGYNLSTDKTCGFTSSTSLPNGTSTTAPTDAQLALLPLGSYGGPTQTIALGPKSIAIDYIPVGICVEILDPVTSQPITTDQRGIARPQGTACDAGAYEAPAVSIITKPGQPAASGWYNATTLGGEGKTLGVSATFTGLAAGELPTCTGATFTGLVAANGTDLNQTAGGSASLGDGTYNISCGVTQGDTALGVSQFPSQPVTLKVDTTLPTIDLTTPANDASYTVGSTIDADYTCSDATSQIATNDGCVGTVANNSPIDTSATGPHSFTVNAADQAGNTATKTVTYTVTLTAPALAVNGQPAEGSPHWYNLANSPDPTGMTLAVSDTYSQVTGYSCTDTIETTTTTLNLTLSSGTPPSGTATLSDGVQTISCTATDGTNTSPATTVTIQVDRTPPTIDLTTPANDAAYTVGSTVKAEYTCADVTSQISTTNGCVGTVANNSPIDTSATGPHSFTVNAADNAGNTATKSVTYTVVFPAPTLSINDAEPHPSSGGYWYNLANSPNGVTLTVSDSDSQVTGFTCTDNNQSLNLNTSGTPLTGTVSLGDGVHTISCTATDGTNTSSATTVTIQIDRTPPLGNCSVPDQVPWYNHNVSVNCTPTDASSGLSDTTPTQFSLKTTVAVGQASANASTGSQQLCDLAGNCVTVGPFDFQVDLASPTISSPAANASYIVKQFITLGCADVGSGIATCQVTVQEPNGSTMLVSEGNVLPTSQVGTYTVTPNTVTDLAGNADTTSVIYSVGYQIVTLPGDTQTVNHGYDALIRIYPADANGHDYASRNLKVTSVELEGDGQTIPFAYQFQYGTFSGEPGYQLAINTRNLSVGAWTLVIQFGTGANATTGTVMFTVE